MILRVKEKALRSDQDRVEGNFGFLCLGWATHRDWRLASMAELVVLYTELASFPTNCENQFGVLLHLPSR